MPKGGTLNIVDLTLTFSEPFCLAKHQLDENIFLCLDYVSGNALAGAIQRALADVDPDKARFSTLRGHFDTVRFRHTFPLRACFTSRPIPTPCSWVHAGPKNAAKLIDAALVDEPALFKVGGADCIPQFQHDWKKSDGASMENEATGWGEVEKELRGYTEIERKTGVAMDERLYAYELVRPDRALEHGGREQVRWVGAMDLAEVPAEVRSMLVAELCELLNQAPLLLGKTDARCTLSLNSHPDDADPDPLPNDHITDYWIATLATDALVLNIEELAGAGRPELEQAYRDAWEEIGKRALRQDRSPIELQHYFSEEKLVGGDYLHHRFRGAQETYTPYLITGAGSVFILKSKPEDVTAVQDIFHQLMQSGLPLRKWAEDKFGRKDKKGTHHPGDYWENCPFIPQNGYGEIVVNHPEQIAHLHSKLGVDLTPVKTVVCQ